MEALQGQSRCGEPQAETMGGGVEGLPLLLHKTLTQAR